MKITAIIKDPQLCNDSGFMKKIFLESLFYFYSKHFNFKL